MNPTAILTLISNLAEQVFALQAENARLTAQLAEAAAPRPTQED